jgi:glycerol uptake facilitator-like aquaporin
MEKTLGKGTYKFLVIYEFLGTAMLLYGVNVSPGGDPFGVIFNILAIILVVGPITGAHLNPAVSTGVLISNRNILP